MSEQTVLILIRLLLRSSLIRIYTVCHTVYSFWRHYCIVKLNCFILRTTTVVSLGVPIFRVFTVSNFMPVLDNCMFEEVAIKSEGTMPRTRSNMGTFSTQGQITLR